MTTNEQTTQQAKTERIATLNDLARTAMGVASILHQSEGICALDPKIQSAIRERVEKYDTFPEGDNPYGERDFGAFDYDGFFRVYWKISYYDRNLEYGSEDPSDPGQTRRVLTIMISEEY